MSKKDYGEVICQAVDEIVRKRLEGITYDSTILCTIVDNSRKTEGIYTVSNNNTTKFDAYSNDDSYRINDNVYVQIPGGDWNEQKFILAKKKDKVEEPFIYKNPFASLVDITGNVIKTQLDSSVGLVANAEPTEGEDITQILLWDYQGSSVSTDTLPFSAYSRLGISASFQSWLSPSCDSLGNPTTVNHGDYGLKLIIKTMNENTSTSDQATKGEYELYLNCADMIGNPYDFQTFYHQEKVFDISRLGNIQEMKLYFYQKSGTFINGAGELISATDFLGSPIAPNLFVAAPYITLGYDVNEFEKEKVVIYTLNSSTYSRSAEENYNKKSINLRWIHQDEQNDELFSVDDTDDLNYEIRWYRYELGHSSADEYSGVYWKNYARKKKENGKWQKWVQDSGTWIDDDSTSFFSIELSPDVTLQEEKIKAIVIYKGQPYRSNILTLTNEKEVVSKPTVDAVQALSIVCEDNTYGNYRIYGQNGSLLDMSERSIERFWVPYFKSSLDNQDAEPGILTEAESVEWIIPTERTMIQLEESFYGDADEVTWEKDTNRIHIKRKCESTDESIANVSAQKYKIKSYYSQSYSDNIIQCKVVKDKITYTATKELTFGTAGTTGTDYTFILDFDKGITAVTADSNDAVFVTARLYDYENNEIDISDRKITWSWKGNDPAVDISEDKLLQIYPVYQDEAQLKIKTISCEIKRTATSWSGVNYGILQASMDWGDWKLIAYLPIPIRSSTTYSYISGTTQVIYNSAGEISACARNPYRLYYYDKTEEAIMPASVTWTCTNGYIAPEDIITEEDTIKNENAYSPTLKSFTDKDSGLTDYYLSPLSFYVEGACEKICVTAQDGDNILWSQPILIMQNRYPSAMLNEWDGNLKVDDSSNSIFAARLVAGKKDTNNTFSGIVLGNWGDTNSDDSLISSATGLYGFDHGEQSYGFKQDGSAFIGKKGAGRIEFKGNTGIIESSNYSVGAAGMSINLKDGIIDAHDFTLTASGSQKVNTGTENQPNIQWRNGSITLTTNSDVSPLSIGSYFSVDWDGTLHATAGDFSGSIEASDISGGTISGSTITGGSISGTTINNTDSSFYVTSAGHLTATSAIIGGWSITSSTSGLSNRDFQLSPDGILKMKNITIDGDGKITLGPGGNASITIDGTTTNGKITFGKTSKKTTIDGNNISVSNLFIYDPTNSSEYAGKMMYMAPDYGGNETDINNQGFTGIGFSSAPKDENGNTPDSILKLTQYHVGASHEDAYWVLDNSGFYAAYKYGGSIKAESKLVKLSIGSTDYVEIAKDTDTVTIRNLKVVGTCTDVYATLA